jgi:hypothetical protein
MWRTLGGGSVAGKTRFSVELSRVLADEADGGTVFVALGGGGTGRGIERRSRAVIAGDVPRSQGRHAPYVHDQHRPDQGVRYSWWRCVVTSGDAAAGRCTGD